MSTSRQASWAFLRQVQALAAAVGDNPNFSSNLVATTTALQVSVATKANSADVATSLATKANAVDVTASLATKANAAESS